MKVTLTNEMKKVITVAEMPAVRKVIEAMKEDENTVKEYAELAARIAAANVARVIEASAEVVENCRVWDAIAEGSEKFDVWITFTAVTLDGFVMGGAHLTDLWQYNVDNRDEIRGYMYIRKFAETK